MEQHATPQRVRWTPDSGSGPGIHIETENDAFVPWNDIKPVIESALLPKTGHIPAGSSLVTAEHNGQMDFVVRAISPEGETVGSVWFGSDPYKNWAHDGLVRVGRSVHAGAPEPVVWLVAERLSDGSYKVIETRD